MNQTSPPLKPVGEQRPGKNPASQRYARYKAVIDCAVEHQAFALEEVKAACQPEKPGFITRIVNELERNGWLIRESKSGDSFRWNQAREFSLNRWLDEKLYGSQIKESPEQERPRERLLARGVDHLTNSELIAILVRSGRPGESAVMAGQKVAKSFDGRLEELPSAGRAELKEISCAVEKTAYCQIMAGIELGRRVAALSDDKITVKISSSSEAVEFCQRYFSRLISDAKQEEFHIVTLNTKNQIIDTHQITVGTLDASLVHPREVFVRADLSRGSQAVHAWHPDVHEYDVGSRRAQQFDGGLAFFGLADHGEVRGAVDQRPEAGTDERLIVRKDDAYHRTAVCW